MRISSIIKAGLAGLFALSLVACSSSGSSADNSDQAKSDSSGGAISVTDVAGRTVEFEKAPERILLAEGRAMFAVSFLNKENPLEHIVALGSDLHKNDSSFEDKLLEVHPELADIPTVGHISKGDVTVENLLSFEPDVVVMTLDHKKSGEESGFLKKMDDAGLKYVFTDFRKKPLENTTKSVTVLGDILGKRDKAEEFNKFYDDKVAEIKDRVSKIKAKPKTFLWRAPGLKDCCATWKESNLADLVKVAGGTNIGDQLLETPSGDLTPEMILTEQPEVIIATGGDWSKKDSSDDGIGYVDLGYAVDPETSEASLEKLLNIPGFSELTAPKEGNFHGVYHQFYDSPLNVFALAQFAAWIHPEEFKDMDVAKDFADFHAKWMPFEQTGTFFVTDDPSIDRAK